MFIVVFSYDLFFLYLCDIGYNFSSFIPYFAYLGSLFFLFKKNTFCMISSKFFVEVCFMTQDMVYLGECSVSSRKESVIYC